MDAHHGKRGRGQSLARADSSRQKSPKLDYIGGYIDSFDDRRFFETGFPLWSFEPLRDYNCTPIQDASLGKYFGIPVSLFAKRVQCEHHCRCVLVKVTKARSVEMQRQFPHASESQVRHRLQSEIDQMTPRLIRHSRIEDAKAESKIHGSNPASAIKAIMKDPALVSDPDLLDYSNSEVVDLSKD
ncbi:unnamed protein product [Camellia sinensis]